MSTTQMQLDAAAARREILRACGAWIYQDLKSKNHWVWLADESMAGPVAEQASRGLLSGLLPKPGSLALAIAEGLCARHRCEFGALISERAMLDPPLAHRKEANAVAWIHEALLGQFPGIAEPLMVLAAEASGMGIHQALRRVRAMAQAKEIAMAAKMPGTNGVQGAQPRL